MKKEKEVVNPAEKVIKKLAGPQAIADILGITRQGVRSWTGESGAPVYLFRALSLASGVPLEEFLAFEEAKKGIDPKSLAKALKQNAEDRT